MDLEMRHETAAGQAGFSMVEALVAAAILLIIAIGMIPLFSRAILNNSRGNDYTQATTHGEGDLEEAVETPLLSNRLAVTGGSRRQNVDFLLTRGFKAPLRPVTDVDWVTSVSGPNPVAWTRTTQTRQFAYWAIIPDPGQTIGELKDSEVILGPADTSQWQIMEVSAWLDSGKNISGPGKALGSIRRSSFQYLKSF